MNLQEISPLLSIVIPCRDCDGTRILPRLDLLRRDQTLAQLAEVIVSDLGSPAAIKRSLVKACRNLGYRYVQANDEFVATRKKDEFAGRKIYAEQPDFCAAAARNYGATVARGKFVAFLDVDLMPNQGFTRQLADHIQSPAFSSYINVVMVIPFIYTNQQSHRQFLVDAGDDLCALRQRPSQRGNPIYLPTSAIVLHRQYYLALGGQFEGYRGWGSEDHDLLFKTMLFSNIQNRNPEAFVGALSDRKPKNRYQYKFLDLAAEIASKLAAKNLVLMHIWHQRERDPNWWSRTAVKRNAKLFHNRCYRIVRDGCSDQPLGDLTAPDGVMIGRCDLAQDRLFRTLFRSIRHVPDQKLTSMLRSPSNPTAYYVFESPETSDAAFAIYRRTKREGHNLIVVNRLFGPYVLFLDRTFDELEPDELVASHQIEHEQLGAASTCYIFGTAGQTNAVTTKQYDQVSTWLFDEQVVRLLQHSFQRILNISINNPATWPKRLPNAIALCSRLEEAWLAASLDIPVILTREIHVLGGMFPVCLSECQLSRQLRSSLFISPTELGRRFRNVIREKASIMITAKEQAQFRALRNIPTSQFTYPFRYRRLVAMDKILNLGWPDPKNSMGGLREWDRFE